MLKYGELGGYSALKTFIVSFSNSTLFSIRKFGPLTGGEGGQYWVERVGNHITLD